MCAACVWMQVCVLLLWSEQRLRGFAELSNRLLWCVSAALCQPVLHLSDLTLVVILFLSCKLLAALGIQALWVPHDNTQMCSIPVRRESQRQTTTNWYWGL